MLTEVKHRDFSGGHPSQYYSTLSVLNYRVSSIIKPKACNLIWFNYGGNSVVKRAQARVVLGWMTSQEVLMLQLYENHLDQMSAKCSIYSYEIWIHVESLLMKHGSMSLTQNHTVKS